MDNLTSLQNFAREIKDLLYYFLPVEKNDYLDLSQKKEITQEELALDKLKLPPADPLAEVFRLLLTSVNENHLDELQIGINEILKCLLQSVRNDRQNLVQPFLDRLQMLFIRSLHPDFAFKDRLWDYLCQCYLPVGKRLLTDNLNEASGCFLDCMADTGKLAARHDLHTDKIQQVFRILEVLAEELQNQEMAIKARDYRQTLED